MMTEEYYHGCGYVSRVAGRGVHAARHARTLEVTGMDVLARWIPPKRWDGISPSGASLVLDARPESGGTGAGPSPMEAVLMALAGCTGVDVVDILMKMRAPLDGLAITVSAERADEPPRVFTKIHLRYAVWGAGLERDQVERAVSLSQEKYCSVSAMLRKTAELTYEIALSEEAPKS